jgi:TolB protein
LTVLIAISLAAVAGPAFGQRVYIDIDQPYAKKFPIAVTPFQPSDAGGSAPDHLSVGLPEQLADNLDLTGLFLPLDPRMFLEQNPRAGLPGGPAVDFKKWMAIGAEFLVTGGFRVNGDDLTLELTLLDVVDGREMVGMRYTGLVDDGRRMVNRFSNEILKAITGRAGVFGTQIVFAGGSGANKHIYMVEFGSDRVRRVSAGSGPNMMPAISPTGQIAYVSRAGIEYQLKLDGATLASGPLFIGPAFTPAGSLLAAVSGNDETNIFRFSGPNQKPDRITNYTGINISPTVSPDGRAMAFVSDRSGGAQIYISDLQGGPARRLTTQGSENTDPAWSPQGDRIAFVTKSSHICTIKPDGSDFRKLTAGAGRNMHPSWSPDGRMIVFSSTRGGRRQLHVMTANGERQTPLLPELDWGQVTPEWSSAGWDEDGVRLN